MQDGPAQKLEVLVPEKPKIDPALIVLRAKLLAEVGPMSNEKLNKGRLKIHKNELELFTSWISEANDIGNLKELAKYISVFLNPKSHIHIAARVSSNEDAHTNEKKAHHVVSNWLKIKLNKAKDSKIAHLNEVADLRLSYLVNSFRVSLSSFID